MPAPPTGADLFLQDVTQKGPAGIRVRYSRYPLSANSTGANDALNPAQYTITGPVANRVLAVALVPDEPQSFDLALETALVLGEYTVTVSSNVQTATEKSIQNPRSATFTVETLTSGEGVDGGAGNDSAESLIHKHMPPTLVGRAWDALIAALAVGDRLNWDNARKAFDQLFKTSASGLYLDRRSADDGIVRPPNIGMSDDLFRQLSIKLGSNGLTQELLWEIMEIFYGSDSVRANAATTLTEPFVLANGKTLSLLMDKKDRVTVTFKSPDFANILQAKAIEVAAAITRDLQRAKNDGYAVALKDPVTSLSKVKIYSGSLGLGSCVQVTGGDAQPGLQFPAPLTVYSSPVVSVDAYNWVVSVPEAGVNRVSLTNGGGTSKLDLNQVQAGDYVVFDAANSGIPDGVYEILNVSVSFSGAALVQYFDINASAGAHSFLQLSSSEMVFFRPSLNTIHQGAASVIVSEASGHLNVVMPATTRAVGRGVGSASYLHDGSKLTVSSMKRQGAVVTVEATNHGLGVGDQILVEESFAGTTAPTLTAGSLGTSGNPGTSDASLATTWTQIRAPDGDGRTQHQLTTLVDGRVLVSGGHYTSTGTDTVLNTCQLFRISATSTLGDGSKQYTYHWDTAAALPATRSRHRSSLLTDSANAGKVLVSGGFSGSLYLETAAVYSPNGGSGSWASVASMANKRIGHQQTALVDGRVLVSGGASNEIVALPGCELYTPSTNTWASTGSMSDARTDHQQVRLADGKIIAIGGRRLGQAHPTDSFILAHWEMSETAGTSIADTTGAYPLTAVNSPTIVDGKIDKARDFSVANSHLTGAGNAASGNALAGEWSVSAWFKGGTGVILSYGNGVTPMVQIETVSSNRIKWIWGASTTTTATISNWSSFWNHVVVVARSVLGGYNIDVYLNGMLSETAIGLLGTSSVTGTWYIGRSVSGASTYGGVIDDVCVSKKARSAAEIAQVYRLGRGTVGTNTTTLPFASGALLSTCEIFDSGTGLWTRTGSMTYARYNHRAILLPDNRVMVVGGNGYRDGTGDVEAAVLDAEVWDSRTGCWYPCGRLGSARSTADLVYIPDKKSVLVAGGGVGAEYFNTTTATWRFVPTGPTSVTGAERLALVDGEKAIFVGGQNPDETTARGWLYQPGEDVYGLGGLNGVFSITAVTANTLQYQTPDYSGLTQNQNSSVSIKSMSANASGKIIGPFVLDPLDGIAVTAVSTVSTMDLVEGQQYATLDVVDTSGFPNEPGWIVIGFGTDNALAPIRYLGKLSGTVLMLDYGYRFSKSNLIEGFTVSQAQRVSNQTTLTLNLGTGQTDHGIVVGQTAYFKSTSANFTAGNELVGSRTATTITFADPGPDVTVSNPGAVVVKGIDVTLLKQKGLFTPSQPEETGVAYITASSSGRVAASKVLADTVATGFDNEMEVEVLYPSDKGLGGQGLPIEGQTKLSDKIVVWGGDDLEQELATARGEI